MRRAERRGCVGETAAGGRIFLKKHPRDLQFFRSGLIFAGKCGIQVPRTVYSAIDYETFDTFITFGIRSVQHSRFGGERIRRAGG